MKEVANTFNDSDFGNRVGLWNGSKVREGGKEGGGEGCSLKPGLISGSSLHLTVFPFFLPPRTPFAHY